MAKNLFDQINDINKEIRKLKDSINDSKDSSNIATNENITTTLGTIKSYFQQTVSTLNEFKESMDEINLKLNNLESFMEKTYNIVQNSGNIQEQNLKTPEPIESNIPNTISVNNIPTNPQIRTISKQNIIFTYPKTAEPEISSFNITQQKFNKILTAAKGNSPPKKLGEMINTIRNDLAKINSLNPILFELSIEAGRLNAIGNKKFSKKDLLKLEEKIKNWASKS